MSKAESKPGFIRVEQAEVALNKITKIRVRHFEFRVCGSDSIYQEGAPYVKEGWIEIFILNREETLVLFGQEGHDLLQALLGVYGIQDPSTERQIGTIYP